MMEWVYVGDNFEMLATDSSEWIGCHYVRVLTCKKSKVYGKENCM